MLFDEEAPQRLQLGSFGLQHLTMAQAMLPMVMANYVSHARPRMRKSCHELRKLILH